MFSELLVDQALSQLSEQAVPSWFSAWRDSGNGLLDGAVWPTRKTENWKYTPLKSLQLINWQLGQAQGEAQSVQFESWNAIEVLIHNGQVTTNGQLPEGVSLKTLSELDEKAGLQALALIDKQRSDFVFDGVSQQLSQQLIVIEVEAGIEVSTPLHLNYSVSGDGVVCAIQTIVKLGARSKLTLAETFCGDYKQPALMLPTTTLVVEPSASLTHYHLLLESGDVRHIGRVAASLAQHAKLTAFHMAIGGQLKRKDIFVRHQGEGSELSLNGVYLPTGKEHVDYHTTLEHEVAHGHSQEVFRGIMGDSAKAVFNGRIHIHKNAQKVVAELNNRNLLLSDKAEINTKPELEIYADDVRCAHGATIAQLDEQQLFYFQARGIARAQAEMLLSFGFINELLDALDDEPVTALLRPLLSNVFLAAADETASS